MNFDDAVAQDDVVVHALAAQVEVAVPQAQQLVDSDVLVDVERRRLRGVEHRRPRSAPTSISPVGRLAFSVPARRSCTVPLICSTYSPRTLGSDRVGVGAACGLMTTCTRPRAVAQVEEDQAAVVAAAVHPAGQRHCLAGVLSP